MKAQLSRDYRVKEFMSTNVATAAPDTPIRKAIESMVSREIGTLVVTSEGKTTGVITERDLLTAIATGMMPEDQTVGDLMEESVTRADPAMSSREAARRMTDAKDRLLVFEGKELVGIVTATDIVKVVWRLGEHVDIGDVVSGRIVTADGWATVSQAVGMMHARRVGSVIVTDRGVPKGIFTERDLLNRVLYPRLGLDQPVLKAASVPIIYAEMGIDGREAAHAMVARRVKRLPLTKDGKLVGMVTARDIVEAYGYPTRAGGVEADEQMAVRYGEVCPICRTRIDDRGLCGCGTIGGG